MFEITTIQKGKDNLYFLIRKENDTFCTQHQIQGENVTLSDDGSITYKLLYNSDLLSIRIEAHNPIYPILLQVRARDSLCITSLERLLSKT